MKLIASYGEPETGKVSVSVENNEVLGHTTQIFIEKRERNLSITVSTPYADGRICDPYISSVLLGKLEEETIMEAMGYLLAMGRALVDFATHDLLADDAMQHVWR